MKARSAVPTICLIVCLMGSVAAAKQDPSLSLHLDFEDLELIVEQDQHDRAIWSTADASRQDVYQFYGDQGVLSKVEHGNGHALRASGLAYGISDAWDGDRVPATAMSVLMWTRLEGRAGKVEVRAHSEAGKYVFWAAAGASRASDLEYSWVLHQGFALYEYYPPTASWVFTAATYDRASRRARLYVNGVPVAEQACDARIPGNWGGPAQGASLECGGVRSPGEDAIVVDDVSLWKRALTRQEIRLLAAQGGLAVSPEGNAATSWSLLKRR